MHTVSIGNFDEHVTENSVKKFRLFKETRIKWDSEIGSGFVNKICIKPGLTLIIENFQFNRPVFALMEVSPAPVEIFYCLSGCLEGHSKEINKNIRIDAGNSSFFLAPALKTNVTIGADEPLKLVTIRFHPEIFDTYVQDVSEIFPVIVSNLSELNSSNQLIYNISMTPEMKMSLMQILRCSYKNAFKKIYLENKAIELIALYFAQLSDCRLEDPAEAPLFTPGEIEKIHQAKSILLENIESPPLLNQLAKRVGMNKDKLNQGFHKVFGTTAFNFFRQQKMEEAKKLLDSKELNITEVAYSVGYSQPGTFSRAFKQYYGINPKEYSKRLSINPTI